MAHKVSIDKRMNREKEEVYEEKTRKQYKRSVKRKCKEERGNKRNEKWLKGLRFIDFSLPSTFNLLFYFVPSFLFYSFFHFSSFTLI